MIEVKPEREFTEEEEKEELVEAVLAWNSAPKFLASDDMLGDPRVRAYAAVWQRLEKAIERVRRRRGNSISDEEGGRS